MARSPYIAWLCMKQFVQIASYVHFACYALGSTDATNRKCVHQNHSGSVVVLLQYGVLPYPTGVPCALLVVSLMHAWLVASSGAVCSVVLAVCVGQHTAHQMQPDAPWGEPVAAC